MKIISLGAGVQSSAMLLMALNGKFGEVPECAIFADTGWEPKHVYEWLKILTKIVAPFPIHVVRNGSIRENVAPRERRSGGMFVTIPAYIEGAGIGRRQCTKEFKLTPLRREIKRLGATAKNPTECWIGISTDEAHRMKPSQVKYIRNVFPLIDARLNREACERYVIEKTGIRPPKSSCVICPYHSDQWWSNLRSTSPGEFNDACDFDDRLRNDPKINNKQYLHRSCLPLRDISEFRHENQERMFFDGFGNECEGMCGT